MAVKKRGDSWYAYFEPFRDRRQVGLKLEATTKAEAQRAEGMIIRASRTGDYSALDPGAREACVRMFMNKGWEMPEALGGAPVRPKQELTLWRAVELFLKYPEVKSSANKWRHEVSLANITAKLGKDTPLKSIWVPSLKAYQIERQSEGVKPSTVNRELTSLSRLFSVMVEMRLVDENPARLVKRLSEKSSERQVYLSWGDVQRILSHCPEWFKPIVLAAYYTGMRRGEILGLSWKQVNVLKRMITLAPQDTKEAHWKRIPIHKDLVPTFEAATRIRSITTDNVFLIDGRPPNFESLKNPWRRACVIVGLDDPRPHLHDLRHTWKTNARRSGMDPEIRESILGHWTKQKSVSDRYGRVSDDELIRAIDSMTFDHGETEILVASR